MRAVGNGRTLPGRLAKVPRRGRPRHVGAQCTAGYPYIKPAFDLGHEDVMEIQLEYLRKNNEPYVDHGIEVLYRFADIDPFDIRARYFGVKMDLGQFERFRRMFHTQQYRALLNHVDARPLSTLQLAETRVKKRFLVEGFRKGEKGVFEWTLTQKVGGLKDGYWYVESCICDEIEFEPTRGSA
mmetsp:Transcript_3162/g.10947  ORF Transcript_3162/g.10947 Transcript_3162/m.10947 type:complete len:183 (+) Transcript_3162:235-783(+)